MSPHWSITSQRPRVLGMDARLFLAIPLVLLDFGGGKCLLWVTVAAISVWLDRRGLDLGAVWRRCRRSIAGNYVPARAFTMRPQWNDSQPLF